MLLTYQLTEASAENPECVGAYVCELKVRIDGIMVKRYLWADGSWGVGQYPFSDTETLEAALKRQQPMDGIALTSAELLVASILTKTVSKHKRK